MVCPFEFEDYAPLLGATRPCDSEGWFLCLLSAGPGGEEGNKCKPGASYAQPS